MKILGISCHYHDAAAALVVDGTPVACAQEERFTRRKHDPGFPMEAVQFCLEQASIKPEDLDYVVFYERPFVKFERVLLTLLSAYPHSRRAFGEAMLGWLGEKLYVHGTIRDKLGVGQERILFSDHHLSHAASAFYPSPFEEAAVLSVDGVGEWTTVAMWHGRGNELKLLREIRFPDSLGLLYSAFTAFLGFEVNEGEYKVMGMAPYGKPVHVDKVKKTVDLLSDGSFRMDLRYFEYHRSMNRSFSRRFEALFGKPRSPADAEKLDPLYADVAASIQAVLEEAMLNLARKVHEETKCPNLCMAGGVALNCVANARILRETPFEALYVQPAATDAGGALGAALYMHHAVLGNPRRYVMGHAYLGKAYGGDAVRNAVERSGLPSERLSRASLLQAVTDSLADGNVVGWFQDRFEWGPRALGNRSILADPRRAEMKDVVNAKIKFREPFRPFAPSVVVEEAETYFDLEDAGNHYPARFMLYTTPVREKHRKTIPAVTHADGSARIQVVHPGVNPLYHELIRTFGNKTGVPVVLNTSFNLRGEPIVTTPENAISTFQRSGMDLLVLGDHLVRRS